MTQERAAEIQNKFITRYGRGKVGTIVGGDRAPVELGPITMSCFCSEDKVRGWFDCPPDVKGFDRPLEVVALLIEYMPARKYPRQVISVRFPKKFMGVTVYYKRGRWIYPLTQGKDGA